MVKHKYKRLKTLPKQTSQAHNVRLLICRTSWLACFWWWRRPETAN